mmetsp:Transcript_51697/g.160903  ORF Transcript_51697/g.160903 Transcript_51697/m.160903 type:complete len:226 (+) Transcript_51697:658-1335(+)
MGVDPHEMTEAVRHEQSGDLSSDNFFHGTFQVSMFEEMFSDRVLCQVVHISPLHARFHALHHTHSRIQHAFVDSLLDFIKFSAGREGACDVGGITVVFVPHVIQYHLICHKLAIVGCSRMAVMKDSCVGATSADRSVRSVSHSSIEITVVQEISFHLIFHHVWFHFLHDCDVRFAADTICKLQDFELGASLRHASFEQCRMQDLKVTRECLNSVKVCGFPDRFAV